MGLLAPGAVFAGHRIDAVVGRGGMGVVYRARQLELDRVVALKVIAPELLEDRGVRERFLREARAAASIEHPNVVPVYAAGEDDGLAYHRDAATSRATTCATLVRARRAAAAGRAARDRRRRSPRRSTPIHRAGLVHRDVKPANVLRRPRRARLRDRLRAREAGLLATARATGAGHWVGTLDYVAPEQIRGGRVDARADVYALGGVLFFLLTGQVPFEREGDEAKLWAQLSSRRRAVATAARAAAGARRRRRPRDGEGARRALPVGGRPRPRGARGGGRRRAVAAGAGGRARRRGAGGRAGRDRDRRRGRRRSPRPPPSGPPRAGRRRGAAPLAASRGRGRRGGRASRSARPRRRRSTAGRDRDARPARDAARRARRSQDVGSCRPNGIAIAAAASG